LFINLFIILASANNHTNKKHKSIGLSKIEAVRQINLTFWNTLHISSNITAEIVND